MLTRIERRSIFSFLIGLVLAFAGFLLSLSIGSTFFPLVTIMDAIFHFEPLKEHLIIRDVRLPRAITTFIIGGNLAVAGAIMQVLTRNPLASPGVFGINAGASFVIVLCIVMFPQVSGWMLAGAGFMGSLLAAGLIFLMSVMFRGGDMGVKLALIGVVIQALLSSFTQGLLVFNEESLESLLFWLAGSVAGTNWKDLSLLIPVSTITFVVTLFVSRSLSVLNLGEEIAQGLGQRVALLRAVCVMIVVLTAGISVATCGPIGFVGLITPHIVRYLVGIHYPVVIPLSALFGGVLLTMADVFSRFINFPYETAVGIMTALIGGPYFIYLAIRRGANNQV